MIFFQNNADKYQIKKTYLPNLKLSHCGYLNFNETKKTQTVRLSLNEANSIKTRE